MPRRRRVLGLAGPFTLTNRVDANPVEEFGRFLKQPEKELAVGWIPWACGFGPAPTPGYEQIPWTAWTLPG